MSLVIDDYELRTITDENRIFSRKEGENIFKVRMVVKPKNQKVLSCINLYMCRMGGAKKGGIAPRGGTMRYIAVSDFFNEEGGKLM